MTMYKPVDGQDAVSTGSGQVQGNRLKSVYLLFRSRIQRSMVFTSTTLVSALIVSNFHPQAINLILAPAITMCLTTSIYLMNDLVDIKVDKINHPTRPLVSGAVKKRDAWFLVISLTAISLAIACVLNLETVVLTVSYLIVGILYSIPKISLKDRFVVKTIAIAVGGFLTSMIGSSTAGAIDEKTIISAISFMMLIFVTSPINDLADYVGDKNNGRKTIPIVIGQKNTLMLAITMPFFIAGVFWLFYERWAFSMATPISLTALAVVALLIFRPLFARKDDYKFVRTKHKKAVFLHYGLQLALVIGILL